jgi:hypothetical protein
VQQTLEENKTAQYTASANARTAPQCLRTHITAVAIRRHLAHFNMTKAANAIDALALGTPTAAVAKELKRLQPAAEASACPKVLLPK